MITLILLSALSTLFAILFILWDQKLTHVPRADQWTAKEQAILKARNDKPLVINKIHPYFDHSILARELSKPRSPLIK